MSLKHGAAVMVLTACGLAVTGSGLRGQSAGDPNLADVTALKCTFSVSSRVVWKNGMPEPTVRSTGVLTLDIREVNTAGGSAVVGNSSGNNDVTLQFDGRSLHFLEVSRGGRIAMTTVFAAYTTGTRLRAAHSRADYLPIDLPSFKSEPEVAQFYGDCEATR